jgi:hypothetical protein
MAMTQITGLSGNRMLTVLLKSFRDKHEIVSFLKLDKNASVFIAAVYPTDFQVPDKVH